MEFISFLQENLIAQLPELIASYEGDLTAQSLSEMETALRTMSQAVGQAALEEWLAAQTPQYPADTMPCPHCGEQAAYVRWREGMSITLLGRVRYRRPYYSCAQCHRGHYPLDEQLGIKPGQMSAEVQQVAALVGIHTSFAKGRDVLWRTAQLELSANSIRKATRQVGAKVAQHEADWRANSQDLEAQRAHQRQPDKPPQIYGSMDGFMAHIEGQWHEMKAGAWWTTDAMGQAEQIDYYTEWMTAAEFSELVWATGFRRLADQAAQVIFVADGAEWIWRIVQDHFPHAVQIVDWYHALSYIRTVAGVAFADESERAIWFDQQTSLLWHGQRAAVFRACRQVADRAPDAVNKALTFFANQRARMRYDRYRAAGFQIGSGTMESGCKQLGVGRLKIAGAQWNDTGASFVAKARAAYLSGQWDEVISSSSPLPLVA
jgi:hypothetical protein